MSADGPEYMAVFEGGLNTPRLMDKADLVELLRWAAHAIETDDSMEGSIMWGWSQRERGHYDVGGIVRHGNSMGQGSVVLLWDVPSE